MGIRHREEGFTLIEVIISVGLLGLIFLMIYSFYLFGQRLFTSGQEKSELNRSLSLASERIADEIRFATELELLGAWSELPASPGGVPEGYTYLYFDGEGKKIILLDGEGRRDISDPVITDAAFSLTEKSLQYRVEASSGEKTFSVESSVYLWNAKNPSSPSQPIPAIMYKKP